MKMPRISFLQVRIFMNLNITRALEPPALQVIKRLQQGLLHAMHPAHAPLDARQRVAQANPRIAAPAGPVA
jgi:hypothetical protein